MVTRENLVAGIFVKTKFTFIGKQKGRELWKAGIVSNCYPHFAVVEFEHFRKSFAYDEIEVINEMEYFKLKGQNTIKKALIKEGGNIASITQ